MFQTKYAKIGVGKMFSLLGVHPSAFVIWFPDLEFTECLNALNEITQKSEFLNNNQVYYKSTLDII